MAWFGPCALGTKTSVSMVWHECSAASRTLKHELYRGFSMDTSRIEGRSLCRLGRRKAERVHQIPLGDMRRGPTTSEPVSKCLRPSSYS